MSNKKIKAKDVFKDYYFKKKIGRINGQEIYYAPNLMASIGAMLGCTDMKTKRIWVDDLFVDHISENAKEFIVYHELGHKYNGDLAFSNYRNLKEEPERRREGKIPDSEFEADYHAYLMMSTKAIDALIELRDLFKSLAKKSESRIERINCEFAADEFNRRMIRLKNRLY